MKYVYGVVPSRRLGKSLGISPIPFKVCNYSCIYCQLGKTHNMRIKRETFYPLEEILDEFEKYLDLGNDFDVVTIVSEGEPLLYTPLDRLINGIKKLTNKKVVLITNGSLFFEEDVRNEVKNCDIIMPTLDAWDEESFRLINRPVGTITFEKMYNGLCELRKEFKGEIWLEVMLIKGVNDNYESLKKIKEKIDEINPDKVFVNVPIRPPAEEWVKIPEEQNISLAKKILNASTIEKYAEGEFKTLNSNVYEAIIGIIKRHPLRLEDIQRNFKNSEKIIKKLFNDKNVEKCSYNGKIFFRFKNWR
ncbi:MAG: radical SAM protein [Thermosipho sp. (in: Bacteria)]|nr:radical SAM protein [Thermosipho sp. (in: thermotogales)]